MIPPMNLALDIFYLAVGFYFLAKSSDWLVLGSSVIAESMGVRQLVIGLTVVAWGTSAPEVVVSGLAAVKGDAGMSMGNVLGSNIANIALVLGASAIILPNVLQGALARRETFWLLASVALFWWLCSDYRVSRIDGAILLGAVSIYNLQLFAEARQASLGATPSEHVPEGWFESNPKLTVLIGGLVLAASAWVTLLGATGIANMFELSDEVMGLTVLAVGTSLPELSAGVSGALKGHSDISIGNVVGSNVFNVTGVVGIVAMIRPFGGPDEPEIFENLKDLVRFDFPVVMGFSIAALLIPAFGASRGGRLKGILLLTSFIAYTAYRVITDG